MQSYAERAYTADVHEKRFPVPCLGPADKKLPISITLVGFLSFNNPHKKNFHRNIFVSMEARLYPKYLR